MTSSGTDSTSNSYRSNRNSCDRESDTTWTETEGSQKEGSASVQPQSSFKKSTLDFNRIEQPSNLTKKKLSYIFEQSNEDLQCDIKKSKSCSIHGSRNSSDRNLHQHQFVFDRDGDAMDNDVLNGDLNQTNVTCHRDQNDKSNNVTYAHSSSTFANNSHNHNQHNTSKYKSSHHSERRNLKGPGSSLSAHTQSNIQSSTVDAVASRFVL